MALAITIINKIRDEIGSDLDVTDVAVSPSAPIGDLETIYMDLTRGNKSVLRTALIVWRRRLADMQLRSFDVTAGGSLLARSQRVRYMQRRVKELEILIDFTLKGVNQTIVTANTPLETAEL
ncbi:MAG: hypothetical protein QGD93_09390 [Actinomycetota bacterium]|nr:hypothetical protein [Actinomycetota bacterium]